MKPTKEIIGLRIISISDGTQVGVVKDFVINPQGKTIDFLIVDQPTGYFGAKIISFSDILGVGEFAVTIPQVDTIQDVSQNAEAQKLLNSDIRVIGTKVLTKKGHLIGTVTEIQIDEENGKIAACIFEENGKVFEVKAEQIITLGKELLIVEGPPAETAAQPEGKQEPEAKSDSESGFNLFEQRQLQYFIGKTVEKDILLEDGSTLRAGEPISPEMVASITSRSILMEITSYLQKN